METIYHLYTQRALKLRKLTKLSYKPQFYIQKSFHLQTVFDQKEKGGIEKWTGYRRQNSYYNNVWTISRLGLGKAEIFHLHGSVSAVVCERF